MKLIKENGLSLVFKDHIVFEHTKDNAFITSLNWKLDYKNSHGNFKVKQKILQRLPLISFNIEKESDNNIILIFEENNIFVKVDIKQQKNGLKMFFSSNKDGSFEFNLKACENEGIFGGGEQYRQLNLKGEKVKNIVSEHIVVKPIVQKTIFKFLPYHTKKHCKIDTYSPMTTFVSSQHYAIRFDVDSFGIQDFSNQNKSIFQYHSLPKAMLFVVEKTFVDIGKALNVDISNNEYLPDWCYDGMILGVQGGLEVVVKKAQNMLNNGAKINGVWCQDWSGQKVTVVGKQVYWNWEVDNERYKDLAAEIIELKKQGVHFLAYINPYLVVDSKLYNYCKENDFLIKNSAGEISLIKSTTFDAGMMDLTNEGMVKFLKDVIIKKNMLDLGIDGYMADFGEYLPTDCVLHNGNSESLHNVWPTLWAKINREAIAEAGKENEAFFFTRSGYNGAQEFTSIMWNGDQHTDCTIDYGMPCVMPATFNLGFSGMTAVHSDVGGFISFSSLARNEELFVRWMEMNTFTPLMRSHETIRPDCNAQYDSENVLEHTVKLSNIHAKLKPYIKDCMEKANEGVPVMRPDFYNINDFSNHKDLYSFFLGDDIYVCPVIKPKETTRKVFLPDGEWIHLITKKQYSGGEYTIDAPLGCPVAFFKKDSKYNDLFLSIK